MSNEDQIKSSEISKVLCFGSINIDEVYGLHHINLPGETQYSNQVNHFSGGKGANQSVAGAKAGGKVYHCGKIGRDGDFILKEMGEARVNLDFTIIDETKNTGKAIIQVAQDTGENSIILYPGCNHEIQEKEIKDLFEKNFFKKSDLLLLQNEINNIDKIIKHSHSNEMDIVYNPAPYSTNISKTIPWDKLSVIVLNQIEAKELNDYFNNSSNNNRKEEGTEEEYIAIGRSIMGKIVQTNQKSQLKSIIITLGAAGCLLFSIDGSKVEKLPSFSPINKVIDTTGAGDCFIGYFITSLSRAHPSTRYHFNQLVMSCKFGAAASALAVTRSGAMKSFPAFDEVKSNYGSELE